MATGRNAAAEGQALTPAELQILLSLADGPLYGTAISRDVLVRTDGRHHVGPGTLYTALKRLSAAGLVEEAAGDVGGAGDRAPRDSRRREYALTVAGAAALAAEVGRMIRLVEQARQRGVAPTDVATAAGGEDPILSLADDLFDDPRVPADAAAELDRYLYGP
jgi:DNA-binding PadR family transcriptional regulator